MQTAEVTVAILQHVPQRERLGKCALVCRSWLAAALEVTTGISAQLQRPAHTKRLSRWLQHHGSRLSNLSIVDFQRDDGPFLDVPFSCLRQLQELHLSGLDIRASIPWWPLLFDSSNSSNHSGRWADLTALTSLHLERAAVYNRRDGSEINSITSLRRLVLESTSDHSCEGLPSLAPLSGLTCLVLESTTRLSGKLKGIEQLSNLQHLVLAPNGGYDIEALSSLPVTLTHLDLGGTTWPITTLTAPRLGKLTALVHLQLRGEHRNCFDPQLLSNLVQLRHLSLGGCLLKHRADARQGVDRLLAELPGLSSLQHLDLVKCIASATEAVQQYSALASSSALTYLDLLDCRLQENAVLHMFDGQQCPALHYLRLGGDGTYLRRFFGEGGVPYSAKTNALDALVAACPALQELHLLDTVVDPDCWSQLSALGKLSRLSKLALEGDVTHGDSIALLASLQLPALRDLKVGSTDSESVFTASWVLHLRLFTQLTRLEIQLDILTSCAPDQHLLFEDKNGLTHLPELFNAALPERERNTKIRQRDRLAAKLKPSAGFVFMTPMS